MDKQMWNGCEEAETSDQQMMKAYRAAQRLMEGEMPAEDRELLAGVQESDTVVVRGSFDRVEDVLRMAGIPFSLIDPAQVGRIGLEPRQLLIVNCPGELDPSGVAAVREFVQCGGSLMTTDWALRNVLEQAFPGFVAYNGRPTGDEVVRIEIRDSSHPFLEGLFHQGTDPLWWLEGSSHPIRILDRERVRVLLTSEELEARYGEAPVAIAFSVGEGDVLHMISHYYLQRVELRSDRHKADWKEYAAEVGVEVSEGSAPAEFEDLTVGEVEAAHTSLRLVTNYIVQKQRRNQQQQL